MQYPKKVLSILTLYQLYLKPRNKIGNKNKPNNKMYTKSPNSDLQKNIYLYNLIIKFTLIVNKNGTY